MLGLFFPYGDMALLKSENVLFDGSGGLVGWLMDGTEDQKCPSNFFILCEYIGNVYTYIYPCSKFVTNFVMGLKI